MCNLTSSTRAWREVERGEGQTHAEEDTAYVCGEGQTDKNGSSSPFCNFFPQYPTMSLFALYCSHAGSKRTGNNQHTAHT